MRASGVRPSSLALVSLMMTTAAAPSLSGQALPAVMVPFGPEHRLELADLLVGGAGARAVVGADDGAVGQRDRDDLALEEAALDGLLGAVLAAHAPVVLVLAADAGEAARRSRRSGPSRCRRRGCCRRRAGRATRRRPRTAATVRSCASSNSGVLAVRRAVGSADAEPRHRLHARGDEHVALAGLDRVERHPGGLQRRRAVPVDGGAGQEVVAEFDGHRAGDVVAGLAGGLARSPSSGRRCRAGPATGTLSSAARTIWAARSSGRMVASDPLTARPIGERAVETMTASGMTGSLTMSRGCDGQTLARGHHQWCGHPGGSARPAAARASAGEWPAIVSRRPATAQGQFVR